MTDPLLPRVPLRVPHPERDHLSHQQFPWRDAAWRILSPCATMGRPGPHAACEHGQALEVGNQVGELMNSPANSVSLFGNVTQCQAVVASCFDTQRNKAVYSNLTAGLFFLPAGNLSGCRAAREASRYPPSRGRPEV